MSENYYKVIDGVKVWACARACSRNLRVCMFQVALFVMLQKGKTRPSPTHPRHTSQYDRGLLDAADKAVAGVGDGRISEADAKVGSLHTSVSPPYSLSNTHT